MRVFIKKYLKPIRDNTKTIEIRGTDAIPEFPSWIILPLIMFATLAVIVLKKTMLRGLDEK